MIVSRYVNNFFVFFIALFLPSQRLCLLQILKEGSEGPVVVTLKQKHLTKGSFAKKFTTLDRCSKTISVNDTVRVSEGPLEVRSL